MASRRGVRSMVAGGVAVVVGVVTLIVGFVTSSLAWTYVSVACSFLTPILLVTGVAFIVVDHNRGVDPGRTGQR